MVFGQIETRAQFCRLLGLGKNGPDISRRWEKDPTRTGAQRPGAVSLRRLLYLTEWQMEGALQISDLDEVDWNRKYIVPRDGVKDPSIPLPETSKGEGS